MTKNLKEPQVYRVTDKRHHAEPKDHPSAVRKRNRKERRSAVVYRVEHLLHDSTPVPDLPDCYVEGELDAWIVVSVPSTTTQATMDKMKETLQYNMNKPVLIVSHNTSFMKAVRLSPSETAKHIKLGEDYGEAQASAAQEFTSAATEESLGGSGDVDGDGGGPGVGVDGSSDTGEDAGEQSDMPSLGDSENGEGEEEGSEGDEGLS